MFDQGIRETVLKVLPNQYESTIISETDDLTLLGLSSFNFINMIIELEIAYNVEIPDNLLLFENFNTIAKIKQMLVALTQPVLKCIILDCDDVLWLGEAGENYEIMCNHNHYLLHDLIRDLSSMGVFICICTRNSKNIILTALQHIGISEQLFAECFYNCSDKPNAIAIISEKLNINKDSFLYIDDDPYQLGLIKSTHPEVQTLQFVNDIDVNAIRILFHSNRTITHEDTNRLKMYQEQKLREQSKFRYESIEDYFKSLDEHIDIHIVTEEDLARVSELSLRTNQFNLTQKRYKEDNLRSILKNNNAFAYTMRVSDRFGDMGIVGAALIINNVIDGFWVSCRVLGRDFENKFLNYIKELFPTLKATFVYGPNNDKYANFFLDNGIMP